MCRHFMIPIQPEGRSRMSTPYTEQLVALFNQKLTQTGVPHQFQYEDLAFGSPELVDPDVLDIDHPERNSFIPVSAQVNGLTYAIRLHYNRINLSQLFLDNEEELLDSGEETVRELILKLNTLAGHPILPEDLQDEPIERVSGELSYPITIKAEEDSPYYFGDVQLQFSTGAIVVVDGNDPPEDYGPWIWQRPETYVHHMDEGTSWGRLGGPNWDQYVVVRSENAIPFGNWYWETYVTCYVQGGGSTAYIRMGIGTDALQTEPGTDSRTLGKHNTGGRGFVGVVNQNMPQTIFRSNPVSESSYHDQTMRSNFIPTNRVLGALIRNRIQVLEDRITYEVAVRSGPWETVYEFPYEEIFVASAIRTQLHGNPNAEDHYEPRARLFSKRSQFTYAVPEGYEPLAAGVWTDPVESPPTQ